MTAPSPTVASSGLVYADVPNRVIAYIIDSILIFVVVIVIGVILAAIGLATTTVGFATVIFGLAAVAISGAYFIYMWTTSRATVGMRVLGLQIGNAVDGKTVTMDQAIRRYFALAAPGVVAQILQPAGIIGLIVALAALGWIIYLLYTTAKSETKQGFHDVFANTMVVKAAKSVV